jgi:type III secretion protein T
MNDVTLAIAALQPHIIAVALIGARLIPVAFLCPLLGGPQAPTHIKLGVVLTLSLFVHLEGGVASSAGTTLDYVGVAAQEILLGTTLGILASLPFDTARMSGRFIDLFRGSSAEAALPWVGAKEAATGDTLYNVLLGLAATGTVMPLVLAALVHSYAWAPLGGFAHTDQVTFRVVGLVAGAFATALAIGSPIAGLSLAVDTMLGFASRASSGMNLQEVGSPLKILGGGAVTWLMIGLVAARLETLAAEVPEVLRALLVHVPASPG